MAPNNVLPIYGNEKTMNLNPLVLTNIQASPYFKIDLYELKTYYQVRDEIYNIVTHLEPWEKGSRNTAGQRGMCGGVRGVGAGGIVSSAYCLLYKLFTLKLTRKQVHGLCTHTDSPYIRGLGLLYIRYTQPPATFWECFEEYLDDEEEIDPKAGGGNSMTIGEMAENFLVNLDWYGTLFPRIPVPIQKDIETKLKQHRGQRGSITRGGPWKDTSEHFSTNENSYEKERCRETFQTRSTPERSLAREGDCSNNVRTRTSSSRSRSRESRRRSRDRRHWSREKRKQNKERSRSCSRERRDREDRKRHRRRSRSNSEDSEERKRHKRSKRSSSRGHQHGEERHERFAKERRSRDDDNFQRDLQRELDRVRRSKKERCQEK